MRNMITASALTVMLLTPGYAGAGSPCGDVNGSGKLSASDALAVLRAAVGQAVELLCAPSGGIQKTGQTTCYDTAGVEIGCVGTGQDGDLQFGVARSFTDNADGTITDDVTGLVWEKLSDDGSIHDKDTAYTWAEASASKVATLNSMGFAGHDDWRVPNRFELDSLVNLGLATPSTYSAFHNGCSGGCTALTCSCTRPDYYWSSSSYQGSPSYAWTVYFNAGDTYASIKTLDYFVRAVRAGS